MSNYCDLLPVRYQLAAKTRKSTAYYCIDLPYAVTHSSTMHYFYITPSKIRLVGVVSELFCWICNINTIYMLFSRTDHQPPEHKIILAWCSLRIEKTSLNFATELFFYNNII